MKRLPHLMLLTALGVFAEPVLAECLPDECRGSPPVELMVIENGRVLVVMTGESSSVTICNAGGLQGRAAFYLQPSHPAYSQIYSGLLSAFYVGHNIRLFFANTPGEECTISRFNVEI